MLKRLAEMRRLPLALAILIVACVTTVLWERYLVLHRGVVPGDFQVYLRAWERVCRGETPYVSTEFSPFKYSPGALALLQFLPRDPESAWRVFGGLSIGGLALALLTTVRYRSIRSVVLMVVGLLLSWKGILETLDYGQIELLMLGMAALAAATFESLPALAGLCLGLLPGFKLPWALLFFPFFLASRMEMRRRQHRFRRFLTGYLGGWLVWASALPSLTFGSEKALRLSQEWILLLKQQPRTLFYNDINQSLWVSVQRLMPGAPVLAAWGVAAVLAGWVLGRLVAELEESSTGRIHRGQALAWISPWLLYTQWINPLAWRWGSVLAVGMPLAWDRMRGRRSRAFWWAGGTCVAALWLLQQTPFLRFLGVRHWTDLHAYGVISLYWLVLIGMA